jgi:hypothetical protein
MVTFRPDEVAAWRQRAVWVEDMAIDLSSVAVEQFPDLPDADPETWFWLASLQLAKSTGLALYCDDAWMRRLAASLGTPAFGTVDLLNVLVAEGRIATADRDGCISVLREHRAVSIPIEAEDLAVLAAVDSSPTGLAILQVAQSGFWTDPRAGQTFEALLTQIVRQDAAHLPEWMGAGMLGATRSARESVRTEILSGFLAAAISHYGDAGLAVKLVEISRIVAARVGAADPLPGAAPLLKRLLVARHGEPKAAVAVVTLASQLPEEDARALTGPFFAP